MREKNGRFGKGFHPSPDTEFKKGEHWRNPKPYWNKEWLSREYIENKKSAIQIALEQKCHEGNILYFLKKLNIKTRSVSEIRKIKHWGSSGKKNPMFGKFGKLNPNWNGGGTPERQCAYTRWAWKELAKEILKRDGYKCRKCGANYKQKSKLVVHHIKPWAKYSELRFKPNNLLTLCEICHKKIHKRKIT